MIRNMSCKCFFILKNSTIIISEKSDSRYSILTRVSNEIMEISDFCRELLTIKQQREKIEQLRFPTKEIVVTKIYQQGTSNQGTSSFLFRN